MPTRNKNRYLEHDWGSSGESQASRTPPARDLDRRNTHRVAIEASLTYVSDGDQFSHGEGRLIELSKEGCRIVGSRPVITGSSLTLSIKFSDGHPPLCLCGAKVCWIQGNTFGVKFAELTKNERQRVQNLVWKLASKGGKNESHRGFRFA